MADTLSKDHYKTWVNRVSVAKGIKEDDVDKPLEIFRNYYRGKHWADGDLWVNGGSYKEATVENMVFSNVSVIKPSVNLNNPKIFVKAKKKPYTNSKGEFVNTSSAAVLLEMLLNYYWVELDMKSQVDKCLTDALIGHWGLMHVGYTFETEKKQDDTLLEINEFVKEDSPFGLRLSPMNFIIDPEAKEHSLEDAAWVGIKWVRRLSDIKKNPRFSNTKNLKSNYKVDTRATTKGKGMTDERLKGTQDSVDGFEDYDRVLGWDIWDRKNNKLISIVDTHDKELEYRDWPIDFEGFPVETLYFNENPDELLPISDVSIYKSEQDTLNKIRSLQIDHIKRISQRKYLARTNALNSDEMDKLADGADGTIVSTDGNPNDSVVPLKDATVSQDIYMVGNIIKQSIREQAGVGDFERGSAQKLETATEAALINQGLTIKRAERSTSLERFIVRIVKQMAQILQQTLDEKDIRLSPDQFQQAQQVLPQNLAQTVVPRGTVGQFSGEEHKVNAIVGDEAQILLPWVTASKEDIAGEFDFNVEVGSTQPVNEAQRKADVTQLAAMFSDDPYIDPEEGRKRILEAYNIRDIDRILRSKEEVQQEQMQMIQAQQQGELQERQMKSQTDLQKTQMKVASADKKTEAGVLSSLISAGGLE